MQIIWWKGGLRRRCIFNSLRIPTNQASVFDQTAERFKRLKNYFAMASPSAETSPSSSAAETRRANVLLSAAYLMPVRGKAITAHSTRARVLSLLEETRARRGDGERCRHVREGARSSCGLSPRRRPLS